MVGVVKLPGDPVSRAPPKVSGSVSVPVSLTCVGPLTSLKSTG